MRTTGRWLAVLSIVLAGSAVSYVTSTTSRAATTLALKALSTNPDHVTGGDVLVQVTIPDDVPRTDFRRWVAGARVTSGGRDVTSKFQPAQEAGSLIGLVTGLTNGKNTIVASAKGYPDATLEITNYPITGPVVSGPWLQPFICQTEAFKLPDGTTLGPPLDANCSAKTVVQYVYRTTGDKPVFNPVPNGGAIPPDLAKTTTTDGKTVRFIVRVETGTMNRGIYQNAILFDPA